MVGGVAGESQSSTAWDSDGRVTTGASAMVALVVGCEALDGRPERVDGGSRVLERKFLGGELVAWLGEGVDFSRGGEGESDVFLHDPKDFEPRKLNRLARLAFLPEDETLEVDECDHRLRGTVGLSEPKPDSLR